MFPKPPQVYDVCPYMCTMLYLKPEIQRAIYLFMYMSIYCLS